MSRSGEAPPPPPTPEERAQQLEVELAAADAALAHAHQQKLELERRRLELEQTPEGLLKLAGLERLEREQKKLKKEITEREGKEEKEEEEAEGWGKTVEFVGTPVGFLKDLVQKINPYANTDTMWTFMLENWETAQGAIGKMVDEEKHLVPGKIREVLAGLTSAQAAIAVVTMLANGTGVSLGYTLPKYVFDKIGASLSKGTQDWLERKLGKGWGWGKEVQSEKLGFQKTLIEFMILVRKQRLGNWPETPGTPTAVEFAAEGVQRRIDQLKYVPSDWKETMKARVATLLDQYQKDAKFEDERYENEILQIADEYIGSTVSGQRVVRDAFNLATLVHNLKLVRGIGYGVLALAERSVKEYHQRQKLEDEHAIPESAFKKKMAQLVGDWQSGKAAVSKGTVELGRSIAFQGKTEERKQAGWKERTIDAVAGWAKVATFGWIGSQAYHGAWNPMEAISQFQQHAASHGGWWNAVTDYWKMNYNRSLMTAPLQVVTGQLETSPDLLNPIETPQSLHEHELHSERKAMNALIDAAPRHDAQQVFDRVLAGAGFKVFQVLDRQRGDVEIVDTKNGMHFWVTMHNDPRPGEMPGMTVYRVGNQELYPAADKPNLHPISLFGPGDLSGKTAEQNLRQIIVNLNHLKHQAWQMTNLEALGAPEEDDVKLEPPPEPVPATPSAPASEPAIPQSPPSAPPTYVESAPATPHTVGGPVEAPEPQSAAPPRPELIHESGPVTPQALPPVREEPPPIPPQDPDADRGEPRLPPPEKSDVPGQGTRIDATPRELFSAPDTDVIPRRLVQHLTNTHSTLAEQYRRITNYLARDSHVKYTIPTPQGNLVITKGDQTIALKIPGDPIPIRFLGSPTTTMGRETLKKLRGVFETAIT